MTQDDRRPGETAKQHLLRTLRKKKTQPQPTPEEQLPSNPLTPWWSKPGHNRPGREIPSPHPQCISIETTGWHPDMTGQPAIVMHGHKPRPAAIRKPCAFTRHIAVKMGDSHRVLYLEPKDIFVLEPER